MGQLPRSKIVIIAVVLGLAAGLLAYQYLRKERSQARLNVMTVVSNTTIPSGTIIMEHMLSMRSMPRNTLPSGTLTNPQLAVGKVAATEIKPGEPVSNSNVSQKYRLSHLVKPYMRAVTVAVDPVVGVAGFLKPGDHVDVITTFKVNDGTLTKTVLQNVELIAIGSEVIEEDPDAPRQGQRTEPKTQTTATLAVMSFDAEKLIFADSRGKVRLALRRSDDTTYVTAKGVTGRSVMGIVPSDSPEDRTRAPRESAPEVIQYRPATIPPVMQEPLLPSMAGSGQGGSTAVQKEDDEKTVQVIRGTKIEDIAVPE